MKTLKFTTSKGDFALMDGKEQIDQTLKALLDEYTPIAKVSEMTEAQFGKVVDSIKKGDILTCFKDYNKGYYSNSLFTAKQSFESLVNSLGWYLWRNPVQESIASLSENEQAHRQLDADWQQAESNTFYSPILLKKI